MMQMAGWCCSQWEHKAPLCVSPGSRLPFALAFYAFQSCRERKKRVLKYWGKNQALGSAVQHRHPDSLYFICNHCQALEKSRADAEKAERH